jgi:hypothetical protein
MPSTTVTTVATGDDQENEGAEPADDDATEGHPVSGTSSHSGDHEGGGGSGTSGSGHSGDDGGGSVGGGSGGHGGGD